VKRREFPEVAADRTCPPDEHMVRPETVPTCVESVSPTGDHILLAFGVCRWCEADMLGVISANERGSTASWAAWIDVMREADARPDAQRRDSPRADTSPRGRWLKAVREP
jgi:hypothetical protein